MNQDIRIGTGVSSIPTEEQLTKLENEIYKLGDKFETIQISGVDVEMSEDFNQGLNIRIVYRGGCATAGVIAQLAIDNILGCGDFFMNENSPDNEVVFDVSGIDTELLEDIKADIKELINE